MFDPDQLPIPDLGLRCRVCGYTLARLPEHRCPECGDVFFMEDYIPQGAYPLLFADGKPVRLTCELAELFNRYHIPFIEQVDPVSATWGGFRFLRQRGGHPVSVPRDSYFFTIDLLRRQKQNEPMPDPPPAALPGTQWTCPHCDETNPPGFELCWNCQQTREA